MTDEIMALRDDITAARSQIQNASVCIGRSGSDSDELNKAIHFLELAFTNLDTMSGRLLQVELRVGAGNYVPAGETAEALGVLYDKALDAEGEVLECALKALDASRMVKETRALLRALVDKVEGRS